VRTPRNVSIRIRAGFSARLSSTSSRPCLTPGRATGRERR
jgi:hypothetical protein